MRSTELHAVSEAEQSVFHFCKSCQVNKDCCRSIGSYCRVGAPVLTQSDIPRVKEELGAEYSQFIEVHSDGTHQKTVIKTHPGGGCVFHRDDHCQIYGARPFDCRVFPLDIIRNGERFYWVAYTEFCHKEIDWDKVLTYGERLRREGNLDLDEYATDAAEVPSHLAYRVLSEITP